ncbi:dihydropteroate synthase [Candidatus Fermentibacteria bacterium]|nr:dihydropteroate synthase [Candidatus Fermentibacteria bacterium]
MEEILKQLGSRVLVSDGAMGTLLSSGGSRGPALPEETLLTAYGRVVAAHSEYVAAGADLLTTDTYGAGRLKLREFGLEDRMGEIVKRAVSAAREASRGRAAVVGSIGPLGSFLMPLGPVETAEAEACFRELACMLVEAGIDAIAIETMTDVRELTLAARAVRSVRRDIPLFMYMSFAPGGRTVTGTPPGVLAAVAPPYGPGACGVNCGSSLEDNAAAFESLAAESSMPVCFQPNAGLPRTQGSGVTWPGTPDDLAERALEACRRGAALVGSCCGSTPDHTRAIASAVKGLAVSGGRPARRCTVASRTCTVSFGDGFVTIGERINPTGKPRLAASIREGSAALIRRSALSQAASGARVLDLNIGIGDPGIESSFMPRAVRALDNVTTLPFIIDSPAAAVVEAGLREYPARTFINSVPAIGSRLEEGIALARSHGAGIVALLMDEHGVPEDVRGRIRALETIVRRALDSGLSIEDILVDPIVLAESASPGSALVTLDSIAEIAGSWKLPTSIGLSNVSFGLPARRQVNRAFLVRACAAGLSAAIMDPSDTDAPVMAAASAMLGAGPAAVARFASEAVPVCSDEPEPPGSVRKGVDIEWAVLAGSSEDAAEAARAALSEMTAGEFVTRLLVPAVNRLGCDYDAGRVFLPQLIAGTEAVRAAFDVLRERSGAEAWRGTVVMATVEGDVHDIGKNIVSSVLAGHGWRVVDLGRNVPAARIVEAVHRENPRAVGLSALLTPSLPVMKEAVEAILHGAPGPPLVIVGGAVVTEEFAKSIGALWGRDAVHGAQVLDAAAGGE